MKTLLLAGSLLLGAAVPHDFFVSILTVRHKAESRTLDLTWRNRLMTWSTPWKAWPP